MERITDNEFAYFLGLCVIRGEKSTDRFLIKFRYITNKISLPPSADIGLSTKKREHQIDLSQLSHFLESFFQVKPEISITDNEFSLSVQAREGSFISKTLAQILGAREFSYKISEVPQSILNASTEIKRSFIMGIADASSTPTYGDRDQVSRCRICMDVPFENWKLPTQICKILQEDLDVKVDNILWGHPNLRTPKEPNSKAWAKEHRIRMFAEEFSAVGFRFEFKKEILDTFVEWNTQQQPQRVRKYCWANKEGRERKKEAHNSESDPRLPIEARKHITSFREVCRQLGCCQVEK